MLVFSYYSRNLLVEQIKRVILTKKIKSVNGIYTVSFRLGGENRLLIEINSFNMFISGTLLYESRDMINMNLYKGFLNGLSSIEKFSNIIDKKLEDLNVCNKIIFEKINFVDFYEDFDGF